MQVSDITKLLYESKRPLIHIGQGVRNVFPKLESFINRYNLPFVTARNANDLVSSDNPLCIGRPGTFAQRGANFAVQLSDLYLAIGTRLSLTQTGYSTKDYARNAKIIQVNIDQAELDKGTLRDPINVCMDAKQFITELTQALEPFDKPDWSEWVKRCQYLRDKYPVCLPEYKEQKEYVNSFYFIDVLSDVLTPNDVIVTDMGFAFQNTHQAFKVKLGQRLLTNCGLAPMGWGLPAAIGAAFGSGRRVILITGDGGLMMNIQELATVMHHKLNIKIFILNNGGYLTIKQTQELGFEGRLMGVNSETGLSFPSFSRIADAHNFDIYGTTGQEQLKEQIEESLFHDGPMIH
ncbi:MAG: thiamine pyrophosphate-binding protein, partial [Thermodesulfobacteriota bacterium]